MAKTEKEKQEKRRKSLGYWARRTSKCRKDNYVQSCNTCKDRITCDLIKRYNEILRS